MPNNNVAILSLMAKFDEKSVDDAAKRLGKKTDEVLSNISDDKFSEKIVAQFDKAFKTLQGNKFKKANLSPYTNGLLDVLVSDKAITEKEKALQDFSRKVISLSKSLSGLGDNALNSLSEKQLNSIITKQDKIAKKNDEIQKKTLELDNRAKNIGKQKNNISTISKNYSETDPGKLSDALKNTLKTNNDFNNSQLKSIDYLSKLLSLYSDMEKVEPEKGTAEAIKYSRDLLSVVNEIKKESSKIDLFSNGKASKYIKDNYNSLDSVNQYTLISSQNDYINKGLTSLKGQEAKLQKELTQYISDSVQKNLQKITGEVSQTIEKAEKKVENLDNKINTLKESSSKNISNISSVSSEKSLQDIEDRLYELHDKYTGENQDNSQIIDLDIKELKEYISLYKEYLKLTSSSNYQADPIFTDTYNMMLENDIELQNYSKKIDKAIQKEKELKEASKTESDTNISSDLSNNSPIVINVNSEQALEGISKVKTSLNELPDKKDISINIKSDDYSSVPLLSDEEGKVVDAFRGVKGSWAGLINRDDMTFFTDKMSLAADYADDMAQSGKVYKANLAFANPLEVDGKGAVWDDIDFEGAKRSTNEIVDLAKQLGHDGVIFRNIRDGFTDTEEDISTVMVSLNAMQIKNAEVVASVKAGTGKVEQIISSDKSNNVVGSQNNIQKGLIETQTQAEKTTQAIEEVATAATKDDLKGAFHEENDTSKMAEIKDSSEAAAQAKQEFVDANKKVQESVDGSENPLETEARLMKEIAEAARSAADAKKEFVEANKQVKSSVDDSNESAGTSKSKGRYAKAKRITSDEFLNRYDEFLSKGNELAAAKDGAILGGSVDVSFDDQNSLAKISAKIKDVDGVWRIFSAKLDSDLNVFPTGFKTITSSVDELDKALENSQKNLKNISNTENTSDPKNNDSVSKRYNDAINLFKKLYDINTELNKLKRNNLNGSKDSYISELEKNLPDIEAEASDAAQRIYEMYHVDSGDALITEKQFVEAIRLAGQAANGSAESFKNLNIARKNSILNGISNYGTKIDKYSSRENQSKIYGSNLSEMETSYKQLCNLAEKLSKQQIVSDEDNSRAKELLSTLEKCDNALKLMPSNSKGSSPISRDKLYGKLSDYVSRNSGIDKSFKDEIKAMQKLLKSMGADANVSNIADQFENLKTRIREAGQEGKSFLDVIKDKAWYGLAAQIGNFFSLNDFVNVIRQAADNVINLNTNLTDLAKVSDASISELYSDFNSYADIAKEIGGTISDTIEATTAWSKNGYNLPDSKELAKIALLYKNVGDSIDIDTANESLISTLKGFKLEAEDAIHVIDVFNEVSNNEAISSAGIGTALQRSAASFNAANTSLEQSVALVTATNSVLQDEEKTGNMWKTVSARLRGAKTEVQEMGEDTEGMVESTSKLQSLIKGMTGFDILEKDGKTFKDIYTIVLNIGKAWDSLNDIDRAALLEALAGKNQSNALAAALSNIDVLEKSYKEAMNSSGSAMSEQEKYQESIQYSIDKTKASLEELSNDLINSKFLKTLIEGGDVLINFLDTIIDKFGVLSTLIAGGGLAAIITDLG